MWTKIEDKQQLELLFNAGLLWYKQIDINDGKTYRPEFVEKWDAYLQQWVGRAGWDAYVLVEE